MRRQLAPGRALHRAGTVRTRVIRYRTIGALVADYEQNLSRGSLFLNARVAPKLGSQVRVVIALSRPARRAELSGHVVRVSRFGNQVNEAPGAQVVFEKGARHLSELVSSLRRLLPGTAVPSAARAGAQPAWWGAIDRE